MRLIFSLTAFVLIPALLHADRTVSAEELLDSSATAREFTPEEVAFFTDKVEPVLQRRCYRCHSTEKKKKGDLALNTREEILIGGYAGPGAVPGKPAESMIFKSLDAPAGSLVPQMPPRGGKLPEAEIELIRKWIEMDLPHRK